MDCQRCIAQLNLIGNDGVGVVDVNVGILTIPNLKSSTTAAIITTAIPIIITVFSDSIPIEYSLH